MDGDFLLICRMKSGDEQAIDAFVRKYYPTILRYCRLHSRNQADGEDMTQEVFIRFFRTLDQYRHYGKALNYLYVIAANLCRDAQRRVEVLPLEELPELPSREGENLDLRLEVGAAIQQLPRELREVTILFFFQGLKQREIAKILGIDVPLVKYRLKRAKDLLKGLLEKEDSL